MQPIGNGKHKGRRICALLFCICIIFLGAVCCGHMTPDYNGTFSLSSGQCQDTNANPVAGEQTLAFVTTNGPNITICVLRASDGVLLRHYDLTIHGDVAGHGDGLLYINQRDGSQGNSSALCAVQISDGVTLWCQTRATNVVSTLVENGAVYTTSSTDQTDSVVTIAALSERDGRVLWNFSTQADLALSISPPIAVSQGAIYVSAYHDSQSGSSTPDAVPDPQSGVRSVCALRPANGQQIWCKILAGQSIDVMATDANTLYVRSSSIGTPAVDGYIAMAWLTAFASADGSTRWHNALTQAQATSKALLLVVADGILFTSEQNNTTADPQNANQLEARHASDGSLLWSIASLDALSSLTVANNRLYVLTSAGGLNVLKLLDGTPAWSYKNSGDIPASATPGNFGGNLIVARNVAYAFIRLNIYPYNDIHFLALQTNDGATLWEDRGCSYASATAIASQSTSTPGTSTSKSCIWFQGNDDKSNKSMQFLQIED